MNGPGTGVDSKRVKMSSIFSHVEMAPPVEVFHLKDQFLGDTFPNKINLTVGAFRTEDGKPWVLPVVKTIEAQMSSDPTLNKEYLPLSGMKAFTEGCTKLLLGESCLAITQNRAFGIQALSGTGSLRIGAGFLRKHHSSTVYLPNPTWGNHLGVFESAGFTDIRRYRYWHQPSRGVDIAGMLEDLSKAPEHSVVILHACAHNPTGSDPTQEEWYKILEVVKERSLFPFFDGAYQGFVSGDPDLDAWAVREFVKEGLELFCAQSFSKNFGLYNERAGQLCVVLSSPEAVPAVLSNMVKICRGLWSSSPHHGARIVATALNNPSLYQEWRENLVTMSDRIRRIREELYERLKANGIHWDHILKQRGMFSFTGLTVPQVEHLMSKYHIYLLKNGRISMCGLTSSNIQYFVDAVKDALALYPDRDSN